MVDEAGDEDERRGGILRKKSYFTVRLRYKPVTQRSGASSLAMRLYSSSTGIRMYTDSC